MSQRFTSKATSINKAKLPAVFKRVQFTTDTVNVDIGGGRFDNATEYLAKQNVLNLVLDPHNRTAEHNTRVVDCLKSKLADTATISNVLNVIDCNDAQIEVLRLAYQYLKISGVCYITVYEGNKTGIPKQTGADAFQQNKKLRDYLPAVSFVFGCQNVRVQNGLIVATR